MKLSKLDSHNLDEKIISLAKTDAKKYHPNMRLEKVFQTTGDLNNGNFVSYW